MKLQAVSNRKLYIQIADQIRDQILAGAVEPGRQLPSERDLALNLGVSRPTVREALIALEVAGFVEVRVGVGAFVRDQGKVGALPDEGHSPLEIMQVRRLLEPEAAALAAQTISPESTARLGETIRRMQAESAGQKWSPDSDRMLHMTIAEASGNSMLREVLDLLWNSRSEDVDTRFHEHLADMAEVRERIFGDHSRIVGAIVSGNRETARSAMADHLDFVTAAMLQAWD
ncbi:GntR family transcriptional regulator, transcriptional repressor for pyruvate dehydrogenase complex [Devosia crocina]|uniref:GntR family transcriptional regulator, transcriptional repressor for pyruvate dehydrogenase complex n=1 Tax=Devosia crocina TaxID=429728 RepID=A0A1I7NUA6_9HYPH|nr:FadR/GntR family transcriptional regulator [Devosia crocina]SFV38259.1 GntR family transcriptional regulator, transcriptional repressor for pyruvate dehydrogenase complex [Devosia crocina]